jgi:hypothetical protein
MIALTADQRGEEPPPGVSDEDFHAWGALLREMQTHLVRRREDSAQIVVPDSTHVIQLDRPDAVIDAIRRVVTTVREQRPLNHRQ